MVNLRLVRITEMEMSRYDASLLPKQSRSISANFVSAACSNTLHATVTASRKNSLFIKPHFQGLYIYYPIRNVIFLSKNHLCIDIFSIFAM